MIDILALYNAYSLVIDFLISSILFIGLIKTTLKDHFPGRGGKAIFIALGLSLSIGLIISESKNGVNIGSLGPFAILLVILIIAIIVYNSLPRHRDGSSNKEIPEISNSKSPMALLPQEITHKIKQEKQEKDFIKDKVAKPDKELLKLEKKVGKELKDVYHEIGELKKTEQGRLLGASKLQAILANNIQSDYHLKPINNDVRRLEAFDIQKFKLLKAKYPLLPLSVKKLVKSELNDEYDKIAIEGQIAELELKGRGYLNQLNQMIQLSIEQLSNGEANKAVSFLSEAIKWHKRMKYIVQKIKRLERILERLTNEEIRVEKKELRKVS